MYIYLVSTVVLHFLPSVGDFVTSELKSQQQEVPWPWQHSSHSLAWQIVPTILPTGYWISATMCLQLRNAHPAGEYQALYPCQRRAVIFPIHSTITEWTLQLSHPKSTNKLVLNRLVPPLDPILRRNQNGFRRGRSTISQFLALRRIIKEMRITNREMALVYLSISERQLILLTDKRCSRS